MIITLVDGWTKGKSDNHKVPTHYTTGTDPRQSQYVMRSSNVKYVCQFVAVLLTANVTLIGLVCYYVVTYSEL